jgi:hypothetical protein
MLAGRRWMGLLRRLELGWGGCFSSFLSSFAAMALPLRLIPQLIRRSVHQFFHDPERTKSTRCFGGNLDVHSDPDLASSFFCRRGTTTCSDMSPHSFIVKKLWGKLGIPFSVRSYGNTLIGCV